MKPYKTEFIDNDGRRVTGAFLPIENGNVGGLEPWMVDALRGNGLGEIYDTLLDEYQETYTDPFQFDSWLRFRIAAAIDAILEEAEE